jgi:RHS repeat-associated protein
MGDECIMRRVRVDRDRRGRVSSVTSTNGVPANAGSGNGIFPQSLTHTLSYAYLGPIYDPRDKTFLGFRQVQETHPGETGDPGFIRTTTFLTSACGAATNTSCTGQVDYGWMRATRNVVSGVEDKDLNGHELTTTTSTYSEHEPYAGLDGRCVRSLPLFQQATYDWDPIAQASSSVSSSFPVANAGTSYYESATAAAGVPAIPLPGNGTPSRLQQWDQDDLGNQLDSIDFGQPGVDTPIRTVTHWSLASGDGTGWSYRPDATSTGYTTDPAGQVLTTPAARSSTSIYDSLGRLSVQYAVLANEPAPMTAPSFAAGAPPGASSNGAVCVAGCNTNPNGIQYDGYGNTVLNGGPGGRCARTTYDGPFAQFPNISLSYVHGCNSANPMQVLRTFDRGFEVPTQENAPAFPSAPQRITRKTYEPFGRLAVVYQPSAQLSGTVDTSKPTLSAQYVDTGYIRYVQYTTLVGPNPEHQSHYKYIDGYNDVYAQVDDATAGLPIDPNSCQGEAGCPQQGAPAPAIASSMHLRYNDGRIKQVYRPISSSVTPIPPYKLPISTQLNELPSSSTTYDAAGRILTKNDPNRYTTHFSYRFNLANAARAVTVLDGAQVAGGSHDGAYTVGFTDGHGRTIETDQHLVYMTQGPGDVIVQKVYTAAGEPTSVEEVSPSGTYARQRNYDTLGRLVSQTEPNTGTWQYVYNDAGDLVGTMDARRCGEVIYRDGLGRTTAEDYSTCDPSQNYSAPDLTTGDGTESFYVYDAYGAVQSLSDRARKVTTKYDPRGRLTQEQVQLATPEGDDALKARYAPHVYTKGFISYSDGNRLLTSTTGTDLPDLSVNGTSTVTVGYSTQGTVASLSSSYGVLLANRVTNESNQSVQETLGDAAQTTRTTMYLPDGSVWGYAVARPPGPNNGRWANYVQDVPPTPAQNTFQSVLTSVQVAQDEVGNPFSYQQMYPGGSELSLFGILPMLNPSEWPTGAAPIDQRWLTYQDDYRMWDASTSYIGSVADSAGNASAGDVFEAPYTSDDGATYPTPTPVSTGLRVGDQSYMYDWRGSVLESSDDSNVFFDRSLGSVQYSNADRMSSCTMTSPDGTTSSSLATTFDAAGNLTSVSIAGGSTYAYSWDEVGHLAEASRTDNNGNQLDETFAYAATGERVRTTTAPSWGSTLHTVNVFDSLVLKNAIFPDADNDYQHDDTTEHLYLRAGKELVAHTFVAQVPMPSASAGAVHTFMMLGDALGSTSFVIDHGTGELVEAPTYQAYGAVDSDYRPGRWGGFREDVRYTGQWDNAEVGLLYMNARYYSPSLNRFISPDPMAIQAAQGDLNPYAYAQGSPFRYVDMSGLDDCEPGFSGCDESGSHGGDSRETADWSNGPPQGHGDVNPFWAHQDRPATSDPWGNEIIGIGAGIGLDVAKGLASYGVDAISSWAADAWAGAPGLSGLGSLGGGELSWGTGGAAEFPEIATPYGPAVQGTSDAALAARAQVQSGATLWKIGTTGASETTDAQFWALENPLDASGNISAGFASRYGIPAANVANTNFIQSAVLGADVPFVTRIAPAVGANLGGGVEAVVPLGGVTFQGFISF